MELGVGLTKVKGGGGGGVGSHPVTRTRAGWNIDDGLVYGRWGIYLEKPGLTGHFLYNTIKINYS